MQKKLSEKSRGRPFRTGEPTVTTGVRLTPGELATIDRAAEGLGCTRGELIRRSAIRAAKRAIRKGRGDA